jgi:hypothetical protein
MGIPHFFKIESQNPEAQKNKNELLCLQWLVGSQSLKIQEFLYSDFSTAHMGGAVLNGLASG